MCEPKPYAALESHGRVIYGFETRTQTKLKQPPKKTLYEYEKYLKIRDDFQKLWFQF